MQYNKRSAIILFTILIVAAISTSFYITSLTISDTDPSGYLIVPLLMLPLFAIFLSKNEIESEISKRDIVFGAILFLLLVAITAFLRFELSYLFLGYRIDMLLFPILIASFVFLLFGSKNIGKFKLIMLYSLLASPLLLTPIIEANQGFAQLNSIVIYSIAKIAIPKLVYIPPITIAANGYQIGIGQACVSVGILIAIFLFLVPIAYLYEGKVSKKILWVASGVLLLFLLNIARMLAIALAWFSYGPTNGIQLIHLFAGILLFYLGIIVIILVSGRYGLAIGARKRRKTSESKAPGYYKAGIVVSILMVFGYLVLTFNYSNSIVVSSVYLDTHLAPSFTNSSIGPIAASVINSTGFNETGRVQGNGSIAINLWGRDMAPTEPIFVYITYPNQSINKAIFSNNKISGTLYLVDKKGISGTIYNVISNNTSFFLYKTSIAYLIPNAGASSKVNVYIIIPASEATGIGCDGGYDQIYAYVLNSFNPELYSQEAGSMLHAYCGLDKLVI